jgi:membrane-associated phospholipid phosphatase
LAAVLWAWAPLVTLARVVMGLHYVSDVFAGALLGLVAAVVWLQTYLPLGPPLAEMLGFTPW